MEDCDMFAVGPVVLYVMWCEICGGEDGLWLGLPFSIPLEGWEFPNVNSMWSERRTCLPALYRVIQEESALLWEMIVWVILRKKVHMYMGPILNGYVVMTAWNLE